MSGMTIAEFAAQCRERCTSPAQGTEGPCGEADKNEDGEPVFRFCGRHWGPVLDAMEGDDEW